MQRSRQRLWASGAAMLLYRVFALLMLNFCMSGCITCLDANLQTCWSWDLDAKKLAHYPIACHLQQSQPLTMFDMTTNRGTIWIYFSACKLLWFNGNDIPGKDQSVWSCCYARSFHNQQQNYQLCVLGHLHSFACLISVVQCFWSLHLSSSQGCGSWTTCSAQRNM